MRSTSTRQGAGDITYSGISTEHPSSVKSRLANACRKHYEKQSLPPSKTWLLGYTLAIVSLPVTLMVLLVTEPPATYQLFFLAFSLVCFLAFVTLSLLDAAANN